MSDVVEKEKESVNKEANGGKKKAKWQRNREQEVLLGYELIFLGQILKFLRPRWISECFSLQQEVFIQPLKEGLLFMIGLEYGHDWG